MAVPVRIAAGLAMAALLVAGTLLTGRAADDMNLAMALTAAWFGALFVAGLLIARRHRALLVPLALGFIVVAVAVGVLIALPTLRDKTVDEQVVTGVPAAEVKSGQDRSAKGNIQLAQGSFRPIAHAGEGTAAVVELAGGEQRLTLTGFETDSGPDLRLYVSTKDLAKGGELGDFEDLGSLKGNQGDQQYELPEALDLNRYSTVVVWCRAFSVGFTSAALEEL